MRATKGAARATTGRARGPLLIVAAWAPELSGLEDLLDLAKPPSRSRARRSVVGGTVGVGLIEAAAGTARLIAEVRPTAVLLVGTAGIYAGAAIAPAIGTAVLARSITLASGSVASGAAYLPAPLPTATTADRTFLRTMKAATQLPSAVVACPIGISRTRALARRLQIGTGADVENLEAFAVARAAAAAKLPFAAALGIANRVGPNSHAEWRTHADAAARAACAAVRATLARLGLS